MNVINQPIAYKGIELEEGQRIRLIQEVKNGLFVFEPQNEGKIVGLRNQVKASVWMKRVPFVYSTDVTVDLLKLDKGSYENGYFEGIVLDLKKEFFAVCYEHTHDFQTITIEESKALTLPCFKPMEEELYLSRFSRQNKEGKMEVVHYYLLKDIIANIEDQFENWVTTHITFREITKEEKENGDYPSDCDTCISQESFQLYLKKKNEIELAFAKTTGVYASFKGGMFD